MILFYSVRNDFILLFCVCVGKALMCVCVCCQTFKVVQSRALATVFKVVVKLGVNVLMVLRHLGPADTDERAAVSNLPEGAGRLAPDKMAHGHGRWKTTSNLLHSTSVQKKKVETK